jgi:hypothetical protein
VKRLQRRGESAVSGLSAQHFSGEFGECFAVLGKSFLAGGGGAVGASGPAVDDLLSSGSLRGCRPHATASI